MMRISRVIFNVPKTPARGHLWVFITGPGGLSQFPFVLYGKCIIYLRTPIRHYVLVVSTHTLRSCDLRFICIFCSWLTVFHFRSLHAIESLVRISFHIIQNFSKLVRLICSLSRDAFLGVRLQVFYNMTVFRKEQALLPCGNS